MAAVSDELMEILRCPVAVHYKDKGDDPGRLRLVRDCWLVCDDSGYKYPIREGIPVMLVDEGEKWKDTSLKTTCPSPRPKNKTRGVASAPSNQLLILHRRSLGGDRLRRPCAE